MRISMFNNAKISYKPDSVLDDYLSGPVIADKIKRATFHICQTTSNSQLNH